MMVDTASLRHWLRQRAISKAKEAEIASDKGLTPFDEDAWRGGSKDESQDRPCPSCGLSKGRHAYFCAIVYPEEAE